jgi:thioredoxin-related protein
MNRLFTTLLLWLFPLCLLAGELPQIDGFLNDPDVALEEAAAKETSLLLFLTTDWCSWCRRLEKDVFADPAFKAGSADWVKLRIDAEKGKGPEWAERFHVSGYPTIILLNSQGREIDRIAGYLPMPTFLETFKNFERGIGTFDSLQEQLAGSPDNLEVKFAVAQKLDERGQSQRSGELLQEILEADPRNASGFTDDAAAALAMVQFRLQGDPAILEGLLLAWPGIDVGPQVYNILVSLAARDGNVDGMKTLLKRSIEDYPNDPEVLNAFAWVAAEMQWNMPEALTLAEKAIVLSDSSANVLDTIAELHFRMGSHDAALKANAAALRQTPEDPYLIEQRQRYLETSNE